MTNMSDAALFDLLRQLQADCGPNRHDQAVALITACIEARLDTAPRIVGALKRLGLNPQHVGIMLKEGTGPSAERHRWRRDGDGRYSLHEEAARDRAA